MQYRLPIYLTYVIGYIVKSSWKPNASCLAKKSQYFFKVSGGVRLWRHTWRLAYHDTTVGEYSGVKLAFTNSERVNLIGVQISV